MPFKKGQSGNPGGRPKVLGDIQELARVGSPEAIQTLREIMQNEKAPPVARVAAANSLLDRGFGKPMQPVSQATITKRAEETTDDELATIAAQGLPKARQAEAKALLTTSWNGDDTAH
jgi:HEAT repeat protein